MKRGWRGRTLAEEEAGAFGRRVLVAHGVQLPRKHRRTAEEHTDVRLGVLLRNAREHPVPVRTTEVRRRPQAGDSILLRADVLHNDVVHLVLLELLRQVDVDLDPVLGVLLLDGVQERVEPFGGAEVTDDPGEVDLGQTSGLRAVEVVQAVPDRLQDTGRKSRQQKHMPEIRVKTHEAKGVTPIPAPTRRTVS